MTDDLDAKGNELQLWRSVITQAITDATCTAQNAEAIRERRAARAWFRRYSEDFAEVCNLAGLDPAAVRQHALTIIAEADHPVDEPPMPKRRPYRKTSLYTDANGVCHTLNEWARLSGINAGTLSSRVLSLGWTIDKAISTPAAKIGNRAPSRPRAPTGRDPGPVPQLITHGGLTLSVPQWAERLGVRRGTIAHRLKHWSVEQALTSPKNAINPRKKGRPSTP